MASANAATILLITTLVASSLLLCPALVLAQPTGAESLAQLEQELGAFPNYSTFVALLQAVNFTAVVGPGESLYNKTIFAFDNAADNDDFGFGLTLVQCGLNDPSNGILDSILAYNLFKGKYTFAQLQSVVAGDLATPADFGFPRFLTSSGLAEIVDPDLINDPTLSVQGVNTIDYFVYPGGPDGTQITCTEQANPCQQYLVNVCNTEDQDAVCLNPSFGVAVCQCSPGFTGPACLSGDQGVCGSNDAAAFPFRCYFNNDPQGRYVCCEAPGCSGFNAPDYVFPHCSRAGYVPPGYGVGAPPGSPPSAPPNPPVGDQGVCGTGEAAGFPTRCYFNSDPQGRYVCCDGAGCDGFNPPDFSFPHCANNGYVPPGYGVASTPPATTSGPSGDQGVCGSGAAAGFPVRCWYNNDPQGRYVCCDNQGCDGFNPPDYFFPHCTNNGFVPPGM